MDPFTVAVTKGEMIVGHIPGKISAVWLIFSVTGTIQQSFPVAHLRPLHMARGLMVMSSAPWHVYSLSLAKILQEETFVCWRSVAKISAA